MTDDHIKIDGSQPWISHQADGVAVAFTADFAFLSPDDLKVWRDGTLLSFGVDYAVTGAGESGGGTVTFPEPPLASATIVIARRRAIARTSDFLAGSALRAAALNTELDRLTLTDQELDLAVRRTLRAAEHETDDMAALPASADRAGRLLSFDEGGNPVAGPQRASVDLVEAIAGAEAGAIAAATSAEAAAAVVASHVGAVDTAELQANHQAALKAAPHAVPVPFPAIPVLANHRRSLLFSPGASPELHMYRPTDSGAWHLNESSANEQWFDLSLMGIGQVFNAAVRHGGSGSVVIDPGTDCNGNPNIINPMLAGQKIRIFPGEGISVVTRSVNGNGGLILEVVQYSANPGIVTLGSAHRLIENALGLYDGESIYNLLSGFTGISLPSGFKLDGTHPHFSFPLFTFSAINGGEINAPRIQRAGGFYAVSYTTGGPFAIGDTLTASGGASLRIDHIDADGSLGLSKLSGADPVVAETLSDGGGDQADIDAIAPGNRYAVTYTAGGPYGPGDTLTASGGASLRVDFVFSNGDLGLTTLSGSDPVASETLDDGGGALAQVNTVTSTGADLPGNLTAFVIHSPDASLDLRVHWRNLEKI